MIQCISSKSCSSHGVARMPDSIDSCYCSGGNHRGIQKNRSGRREQEIICEQPHDSKHTCEPKRLLEKRVSRRPENISRALVVPCRTSALAIAPVDHSRFIAALHPNGDRITAHFIRDHRRLSRVNGTLGQPVRITAFCYPLFSCPVK
jgi:hypothetical protein